MAGKGRRQNLSSEFVTKSECAQITASMKDDLKTIKEALVGKDLRGGLVADVAGLKNTRRTWTTVLREVIVPIAVAVLSTVITAAILLSLHF